MDPNALHRAMYQAAMRLQANELANGYKYTDEAEFQADVETLANGFIDLHDWIMKGGFLPTSWADAQGKKR